MTDLALKYILDQKKIYKFILGIRTLEQLDSVYQSIFVNYKKKIFYDTLIKDLDTITKGKNLNMLGNFYN